MTLLFCPPTSQGLATPLFTYLTAKTSVATTFLVVSRTFKKIDNESHGGHLGVSSLVIHRHSYSQALSRALTREDISDKTP